MCYVKSTAGQESNHFLVVMGWGCV